MAKIIYEQIVLVMRLILEIPQALRHDKISISFLEILQVTSGSTLLITEDPQKIHRS